MGYIVFRTAKIKSLQSLAVSHAHNQRLGYCDNADASRRFMNQQIMPCTSDYAGFVNSRIATLPSTGKAIRKDAVRAVEMIFRVSAEEMDDNMHFDLDEFCTITRKWVCDKFGAENVADLVLHMDEGYGENGGSLKCAPHIHAVIVPITKDGRLSASDYFGSPSKLQAMQSEVAAQFKELHLKRGLEGSVAKPHEMKEFYGWVHAARTVELPTPAEHKTAYQYAVRIKPEIQKMQSQHLSDNLKTQRERDEALTQLKQMQNPGEELQRLRAELEKKERELAAKERAFQKDAEALQQWKDLYNGLTSLDEDDRAEFFRIAGAALSVGREARENEERVVSAR